MAFIEWLAVKHVKIAFPMQGHTLMTLLISYLVVAKVNLSYERYVKARYGLGQALMSLRELHQLAISYTFRKPSAAEDMERWIAWRALLKERIEDLVETSMQDIQTEESEQYRAQHTASDAQANPPFLQIQQLRIHLIHYCSNLQTLERIKLMDCVQTYSRHFNQLRILASTPLPFPLVQMSRTFLFLWTFTIPLVLRGVVDEFFAAMGFVFFLTYGFVGLELVAVQLAHPFAESWNDWKIAEMKRGLDGDVDLIMKAWNEYSALDELSSNRGVRLRSKSPKGGMSSGPNANGADIDGCVDSAYMAMPPV
eukprot:Nitzschia sp. Nitz4//scaffold291_size36643//7821//8750//NITZ4_007761-RA/size36643-processed-gene-0.26-mRNA-1//-1//CDS//3329546121//1727//frame0